MIGVTSNHHLSLVPGYKQYRENFCDSWTVPRVRLSNFRNSDPNEQAVIALKRGTQLEKHSRKGKPKFRDFRLSSDESKLIWQSGKKEKNIQLSSVKGISLGQRSVVFSRYPRPEKDYLSFSLEYQNGQRTLDLICKDQAELDIWISGLGAVIKSAKSKQQSGSNSERNNFSDETESVRNTTKIFNKSDNASDGQQQQGMMLRTSVDSNGRVSVSSSPSNTSSGQEDIDSLSDVFIWGEVWAEVPNFQKINVLIPKPLDTDVALDVLQVACGFGHAALVTGQKHIYTWGEEYAGRLGRGSGLSASRPKPVEISSYCNMDYVSCGQFITCAIDVQGDLFTWGDMVHNSGLLGHGSEAGHIMPKRVSGPLEGLPVLYISCGSWHAALVTCNHKLFTFGDGAFGVLGHGNRESTSIPKEVELPKDFKTMKVACGVWHTAAIIDVGGPPNVNVGKLFTWGDGSNFRLGHGDKESRLKPTHIQSLVEFNFNQVACGDDITVALTTSGHIFTMGSNSNGQLGNPQAKGKNPCRVQDRIAAELVEEIACGSCHVVALTSRNEVYAWGKGSNGRLGHGDTEDRKTPTLIEALKDRHVKSISCGSNFTACICIHKWVPTNDQSVCAGCRQAFGFARKRHNCYHCGLVHCHSCSSRKALKAQLAPVPSKPHRVCDLCYAKLKSNETNNVHVGNLNNKFVMTRRSTEQGRSSRLLLHLSGEPVKYPEMRARNEGRDSLSIIRTPQVQLPTLSALHTTLRPIVTPSTVSGNGINSNGSTAPTSPYSRRPSPTSTTPLLYNKTVIDNLKKTNELLIHENQQLQSKLEDLKKKSEIQEDVLHKTERKAKKAYKLASNEYEKCNATLDLIKSFDSKLKDMEGNVPPDVFQTLRSLKNDAECILTQDPSDRARSSIEQPIVRNEAESSAHDSMRNSIDGDSVDAQRASVDLNIVETIERFEPGVYVTIANYPNGSRVFKYVNFNKKRYTEEDAAEWWRKNEERVMKFYNDQNSNTQTDTSPPPPPPTDASP